MTYISTPADVRPSSDRFRCGGLESNFLLAAKLFSFAFWIACLLPFFASSSVHAAVGIHAPIGSHAILQRDKPVPVWGSATLGEEVTVEFAGQKKSTKADEKGKWKITLDPLAESKNPQTMIVKGATGAPIQFEDVLVGEVWLGLGASNMNFSYERQAEDSKGRGEKDDVLAGIVAVDHPLVRFKMGKGWAPATSDLNKNQVSALMLSFGVALQKELDVPLGLIVVGMGSTVNGASKQAFEADPAYQKALAQARERFDEAKWKADRDKSLKAWEEACLKARADGKPEPGKPREPLRPGEGNFGGSHNDVIIRGIVWDQGEGGTGIEAIDQPVALGALVRHWRKEWGQGDFPCLYVQKPVGGGCAWDPQDPVTRFASPFAPLPKTMPTNALGTYNRDREEYHRVRENPGFFMVTSSDLGGYTHPTCKSGYGARAARVALGGVYGRKVEIYGPVYKSHAVDAAGKVRIQFTHVGQGLAFPHGDKLQGFALAGADKQFHWADAAIDGDTVVVSSPKVAAPEAVRYAWAGYPAWANLFNKDGLPALSFRTDNWAAGD
jgi:sialate O-acetylesterase